MKRTAEKEYKEYIVLNKEEITHIKDLVQRYCECIEFESKLSVCDSIEKTVDTALQQAEAMRQSILKKAFEGEI